MASATSEELEIQLRPFSELTKPEFSVWARAQAVDEKLGSPFYRPEFAAMVAAGRSDVEVAVIIEKGFPSGFLPYHRITKTRGVALGLWLNPAQGIINSSPLATNVVDILKAVGLGVLDFEYMPAAQTQFQPHERHRRSLFHAEMPHGFDVYCEMLRNRGTVIMLEAERHLKKMEREVGTLRLTVNENSADLFEVFQRWTQEKYSAIGGKNPLAIDWVTPMLNAGLGYTSPAFSGMMIGLYAGQQLMAVEYGLRAGPVYYSWWNGFDSNFVRYAPTQVMRYMLFRWAAEQKIRRIDFGLGGEDYKPNLATHERHYSRGFAATALFPKITRNLYWGCHHVLQSPALQDTWKSLSPVWRMFRPKQAS